MTKDRNPVDITSSDNLNDKSDKFRKNSNLLDNHIENNDTFHGYTYKTGMIYKENVNDSLYLKGVLKIQTAFRRFDAVKKWKKFKQRPKRNSVSFALSN